MIDAPDLMRARVAKLTRRQREVLRLICLGDHLHTIAERMKITHATARNHARALKDTLRAATMAQAAAIFVAGGGLDEGDDDGSTD